MIRDSVINCITSVSHQGNRIFARTEDIHSFSEFDSTTGERLSGVLDLSPEEILYLTWRQKQSSKLSETYLRRVWKNIY